MLIDLDMPAKGQPIVAWPKGAFPSRPLFAVVIPPGGTQEDARLFAVTTEGRPKLDAAPFHEGPRPEILPTEGYVLETVDPEAVPRLFERGEHPGDLIISGAAPDRYNRPEIAVLVFYDLSEGFTYDHKLSTPAETRLGLAKACEALGSDKWLAAANQFDPMGFLRNGVLEEAGGNPMTQAEFHRYMLERQEASMTAPDVEKHPMTDYRSLTNDELAEELVRDSRAILYGNRDMRTDHSGYRLLAEAIPAFAAALREGRDDDLSLLKVVRDLASAGDQGVLDDPAMRRLAQGTGAGANCWRNLFHTHGLIDTAEERANSPTIHRDMIDGALALPDWARRFFRDPESIVRSRVKNISHVRSHLFDKHRPFLALPLARIAGAPGLKEEVSKLPAERLREVLDGTLLLIQAFNDIPSNSRLGREARNLLSVGWHVLATEVIRRRPDWSDILTERAPRLPPEAAELSFLARVQPNEGVHIPNRLYP